MPINHDHSKRPTRQPASHRISSLLATMLWTAWVTAATAADWPMWRHDPQRSAASSLELPAELHLQWARDLGTPAPAWPREQDYHGKLEFDRTYQPIVIGKRVIVPSMVSDSVAAYDTESGNQAWRFHADGPVRFAPVGSGDRVYFTSDDGHLYCLNAKNGELRWKVRGGPTDRAILGNERLISSWPARGAPVLADGVVYFGAGIWPFMGIFIHAVDAESGTIEWTNSGTGAIYNLHQHGGADAFGGIAPQGYMAVQGNRLIVAGGLSVPAIFDRETGEFLHFEQSHTVVGKGAGGFDVAAYGDFYFNNGQLFSLADGKPRLKIDSPLPILANDEIVVLQKGKEPEKDKDPPRVDRLRWYSPKLSSREVEEKDRRGNVTKSTRYALQELRLSSLPVQVDRLLLQAGSRLFVSVEGGSIAALEPKDKNLRVVWQQSVPGTLDHLLVADDKLFAVTVEGTIVCYGGAAKEGSITTKAPQQAAQTVDAAARSRAAAILKETGKTAGIALVWGLDNGQLVEELIAQSNLYVIAVDADAARVDALRRRLDDAGLYGRRAHLLHAVPHEFPFPPYLAELVVTEQFDRLVPREATSDRSSLTQDGLVSRLFHTLRPYGGVACLTLPDDQQAGFLKQAREADLPGGEISRSGGFHTVTRVGPLPGAGQWTHQYASSANTVNSGDSLVKAPLGVLWFGGPSNHYALPRHAQGPVPQVAGGRLIIEGVNWLSARCVYTGRTLWRREFPDIGFPYKAENHSFTGSMYIKNQPGANFIGSNYVSLPDSVYVVYQNECQRLDAATGETLATFRLPAPKGSDQPDDWGYIGTWGEYLVAGASPQIFDDGRIGEKNWNRTSSRRVVVMNRFTGEVLWTREAAHGFRHNAIVPVADKLFLIDRLSDGALELFARRGRPSGDQPQLTAHDLSTGQVLWSTTEEIFGTWLSYSEEHDVLIQAGRTGGREPLPDEPTQGIIAYQGENGNVLWSDPVKYTGPLILHGDQIISSGRKDGAIDLLTGKERKRLHPITGKELPWTHTRTYGCGSMLACENLLTFRSGAAGYFDLGNDGGTGNLGGMKAGCTPNLVPADGVLNAPDYTRTCTCSYQNQTSLAFIHQPDVETWTYSTLSGPGKGEAVQRIGINLGAPGDRLADDDTLWLEYPSVGGTSPDIPIKITEGEPVRWFRQHSSLLSAMENGTETALPWVAASGVEGAISMHLTLESASSPPKKTYTVRLHFAEPDAVSAGERVFGVALQGRQVESDLDVVQAAAGNNRPLVRTYRGISVADDLTVELRPVSGKRAPILSGIEIVRE